MSKITNHTQIRQNVLGIQKVIERQEYLNSAVLEYQDMLARVQQNLASPLVAFQPVFEQYSANDAMAEFLNAFSNQMQSIIPFSLREQATMNMGTSLEIFGNACRELCESIASTGQIEAVWKWANGLNIPEYGSFFDSWKERQVDWLGLINQVPVNEDEVDTDEGFSCNEEIHAALEEQIKNPVGFQERASNWTEKKIKQFFIVYLIIKLIWGNIVQPYVQENIGKPVMAWTVAHIRELPSAAGNFIMDLKDDIEAIIVENCPYYYKVSFVDENGETQEGYVPKRSVKIIEKAEEAVDESIE